MPHGRSDNGRGERTGHARTLPDQRMEGSAEQPAHIRLMGRGYADGRALPCMEPRRIYLACLATVRIPRPRPAGTEAVPFRAAPVLPIGFRKQGLRATAAPIRRSPVPAAVDHANSPHQHGHAGNGGAISVSRGAERSFAESTASSATDGQSMARSGSSQAMPPSVSRSYGASTL